MSIQENKATMRRLYDEVINTGNLDLADDLVATDFIDHEESPGSAQGLEGFKQVFQAIRTAFPDVHFTVEDMLAEEDKVISRITIRGTHQSEFMGIAPTGKRIQVGAIDICRFSAGKVAEHWGQSDTLSMMKQLGAVATPAAGGS